MAIETDDRYGGSKRKQRQDEISEEGGSSDAEPASTVVANKPEKPGTKLDAPPDTNPNPSGERKRCRAACMSCWERKLRCTMLDGGACLNCVERNRQCIPRIHNRRPSPHLGLARHRLPMDMSEAFSPYGALSAMGCALPPGSFPGAMNPMMFVQPDMMQDPALMAFYGPSTIGMQGHHPMGAPMGVGMGNIMGQHSASDGSSQSLYSGAVMQSAPMMAANTSLQDSNSMMSSASHAMTRQDAQSTMSMFPPQGVSSSQSQYIPVMQQQPADGQFYQQQSQQQLSFNGMQGMTYDRGALPQGMQMASNSPSIGSSPSPAHQLVQMSMRMNPQARMQSQGQMHMHMQPQSQLQLQPQPQMQAAPHLQSQMMLQSQPQVRHLPQ